MNAFYKSNEGTIQFQCRHIMRSYAGLLYVAEKENVEDGRKRYLKLIFKDSTC